MAKHMLATAVLAVLIASCAGQSPAAAPAPIARTVVVTQVIQAPTLAPTQIPLSEISFDALLVQPNDLPPGFAGAQIKDEKSDPHTRKIVQTLALRGEYGGAITISLYQSKDSVGADWNKERSGALSKFPKTFDETGEQAIGYIEIADRLLNIPARTALWFTRCNAFVEVFFFGTADLSAAATYAKRLDKRIAPIVCRES
jgi:hypothetical protein